MWSGLYQTPNALSCEHNYHHHPNSSNHLRYHSSNHHFHHQNLNHPRSHHNNKLDTNGTSSVNASLIAINHLNNSTGDGLNKSDRGSKINLSTTNINKFPPFVFSSTKNLENVGKNLGDDDNKNNTHRRTSIGSTSSGPAKLLASNIMSSALHLNDPNLSGSFNQVKLTNSTIQLNKKDYESFWNCTKPCGILTTVFGVLLFLLGLTGFLFLFEKNICNLAETCSNALLKVGSVSGLVLGVFLTFIGVVIVVYTKKDVNNKVIIMSAKNFDRMINLNKNQHQNQQHNNNVMTKSTSNIEHLNIKKSSSFLNASKKNISLSNSQLDKFKQSKDNLALNVKDQQDLNVSEPLLCDHYNDDDKTTENPTNNRTELITNNNKNEVKVTSYNELKTKLNN